jgi:hypothetical protein
MAYEARNPTCFSGGSLSHTILSPISFLGTRLGVLRHEVYKERININTAPYTMMYAAGVQVRLRPRIYLR